MRHHRVQLPPAPPPLLDPHPTPPAAPEPAALPGNRWQVQLLGGLQLRCGDVPITRLPDRPTLRLFARLALQPQVLHGRDSLARALWPEILDASGLHERADAAVVRRERLRKTLSKLMGVFRGSGRPHALPFYAERETLQLNAAAFEIDVHRFDRHCQRRQPEAARACYGGELLPGVSDEYIDRERARLAAARAQLDQAEAPDADAAEADADDLDADPYADTEPAALPPAALSLPPARRHFFGRNAEIEQLRRALQTHRLVTLTGPGGCGKTALAVEVAGRPLGLGVVATVWLDDCPEPAGIVDRVRVALDLQRDGGDPLAQIAAHLDDARALLVLDNFEHLVGAAGDAEIDRLLQALPKARLLLTTRRELARADAQRIELRPLPLPDEGDALAAAERNPGVALFVAAARAARADFSLNQRNLAGVVEVCRVLEGLPLAIALAAAKIRSFAPREMAAELAQSVRLLARTQLRGDQDSRHASLAAALDWSWKLLDDEARAMLRSLAPFRGGWTLEQARALPCGPQAEWLLAALARDSLLLPLDAEGGPARLSLLGALREFVIERCTADEWLQLRRQHRGLFLAAAQRHAGSAEWPPSADDANFVEAMVSAVADDDDAAALALAVALAEPWRARGVPPRAIEHLHALAGRAPLPAAPRVELLTLLVTLLINAGLGRRAEAAAAQALALAGDEPLLRAQALLVRADVLWRVDRTLPGKALTLEILAQVESLLAGLPAHWPAVVRLRGRLLLAQGRITLMHLGQVEAAAAMFEQAERLFSVLGDRRSAVLALPGRSTCLLQQRHYREVVAVAGKGEREAAALGDTVTRLQLFDRLSNAHEALGQPERALQACQRQIRLARRHGLHYYASFGVWNQCAPLAQLGQPALAVRLLAFACRHWYDDNGELDDDDKAYVAAVRKQARAHLGVARLRAAWAQGQALTLAQALELAAGRPLPGPQRTP